MNIQFEYLYRDAGNNKNWGKVVFANPHNFPPDYLLGELSDCLIDGAYFEAAKVGVPNLQFPDYDPDLDHGWHEFDSLLAVSSGITDQQERTIERFLADLQNA